MQQPNVTEPMLQFFAFAHLSQALAEVSRPFHDLAVHLVRHTPRNPERTVALRKLLEAKDCAVRAMLYKGEPSHEALARTPHEEAVGRLSGAVTDTPGPPAESILEFVSER